MVKYGTLAFKSQIIYYIYTYMCVHCYYVYFYYYTYHVANIAAHLTTFSSLDRIIVTFLIHFLRVITL